MHLAGVILSCPRSPGRAPGVEVSELLVAGYIESGGDCIARLTPRGREALESERES